eukprot:TRINITY_DN5613_c0_g1_i1.p1 TRINITY_DN5613_c0_g1~~TRINITY_DN5613_c0_g1_i1.p1  ORF type:complete len:611 (+),score=199.03 TRINITY_DN5613_c0_g1_i1:354-2186(+)
MSDPSSYSNFTTMRVTHYALDWTLDFQEQVLGGSVAITAEAQVEGADVLVLDSRDLEISSMAIGEVSVEYTVGSSDPAFGAPITVTLPNKLAKGDSVVINVAYKASKTASAVQWLSPLQTTGKKHPFLFTQAQAIHARSFAPCQDSPSAKATYTSVIDVPAPLTAIMSALSTGSTEKDGRRKFTFEQKIPIPSYLIALAVGDLASKKIGPRSAVWTENIPELLEASALDFSETEKFISLGEEVCGDYIWGKYDLLVLPNSFPYGGMENPTLTFVTPALLTGDKANADVVAHEIAHSWSGNLVTNNDWESFWLNEGFTMFIERKIISGIHGKDVAHLNMILGYTDLQEDVKLFEDQKKMPLTKLSVDLKGVDPDDAFSTVPYEKGFNFLFYLESVVGEELFGQLLKEWFAENAQKNVSSADWKNKFISFMTGKVEEEKLAAIDWEAWLTHEGMPPVKNVFDQSLEVASTTLANEWVSASEKNEGTFPTTSVDGWKSLQIQVFLDRLREAKEPLTKEAVAALDSVYSFSSSSNMEMKFRFFLIAIRSEYAPALDAAVAFVTSIGRMKYVRPLYRALFASEIGKAVAVETFKEKRGVYHSICSNMVAKDLNVA